MPLAAECKTSEAHHWICEGDAAFRSGYLIDKLTFTEIVDSLTEYSEALDEANALLWVTWKGLGYTQQELQLTQKASKKKALRAGLFGASAGFGLAVIAGVALTILASGG